MHSAPSVSYPVGRSRFAGVAMLFAWLLGAAAVGAWWLQAQVPQWRSALALALVTGTGVFAATMWRRTAGGELAWDGESWRFSGASPAAEGAISVALDFQRWLLVHWRAQGTSRWLWLERASRPERWDDLRRAVYSRARPQEQSAAAP